MATLELCIKADRKYVLHSRRTVLGTVRVVYAPCRLDCLDCAHGVMLAETSRWVVMR